MSPYEQKDDIIRKKLAIKNFITKLQNDIKVLNRGMKAIDKGGDMILDDTLLASMVRDIMKGKP